MKRNIILLITTIFLTFGCSEEWLEPDPLSFFAPESALTDKEGMEALIVSINKRYRHEYAVTDQNDLLGEWNYSDFSVNGAPPASIPHNLETQMTPTSTGDKEVVHYWDRAWAGIKDANIIISRIDEVEFNTEADKNEILSKGYFSRAYWYYRMVHQFGDVPFIAEEINSPRLDFYSHSREAILKKITEDLEFAVQWLPIDVEPGDVNRAAGSFLLTKCYLSLREFDKAISEASKVIDGGKYHLMTERFGSTEPDFFEFPILNPDEFDVIWDLHQKYNKSLPENKEAIFVVQDEYLVEGASFDGTAGTGNMRDTGPTWWHSAIKDPNGARGTTDKDYDSGLMMIKQLGRGIGRMVPSQYFRDMRWEDTTDIRYSHNNYFGMERYLYNNPSSEYYGQPFNADFITDMRAWYPFMYNKLFVIDDAGSPMPGGGWTDLYVYRLAELYLLRAEAYWWKGDIANATKDVNTVRARANANPKESVDIDYIFDERARELYYETPRKTELTRVAYIMAQLGRDGYSLDNMHENNWFYDRVIRRNNFYKDEVLNVSNIYKMLPYHVYWPIKENVIRANSLGHINQAMGYPGSETNIPPLTDINQQKPAE
ncbi:MAG: RagB/SusD family nutrient uptake outer membrane protein [Bacteroidales bacterium]